jgi:putative DNA primase/helicase
MKEKHWQDLKGSGISDEIITLNFRSVEGDAIYEDLTIGCTARRNDGRLPDSWLKLYSHCTEGGWWSNGISLVDFQEIEWGCFKPDKPRLDTTKEKPKEIKYEHPKGVPTDIFVLKVGKAACTLINELWEANLEPDTFWQGVIDNKDLPVFITEGAKKAACLLSNGFIAIALPGIWNGCKKEGEGHVLHPSLVPLVGRTFFIAFDHDTKPETKRQVTGAANRLKKVLEALDSPCYSLAWIPAFKGCDDLIVEKGADYFRAVVDKALKKTEVKTSTPLQPAHSYVDDSNPDQSSQTNQEAIILPPSYSYQERAVMAIYGKGKYLSHGGELFKYNGKFYEKLESEVEALKIRDWARKECEWNQKESRYVYKYLTPTCLDNIWKWALIVYAVSSKLINPPGLNLSNGILTLYQKGKEIKHELLPHTPDKYFLYCSDVEFTPDANPKFCDQLLEALDPPERKIFVQTLAAGLDLAWVRKHQGRIKAIIAKGSGSNGKDSIKNAIVKIFTQEQLCNVPFSSFKAYDNGQKYDLTKLRDKKVNWSSENNQTTVLDRSESLNCAITGNGIDYRDMNKLPKEFEPVCINIFNVNLVPKATGGLESFLSRFAVIEFTKTFANDPDPSQGQIQADSRFAYDPEFMRSQVCPALLNLLLSEFPNVVANGIDYSPLKKSLNELQEDSNHLWGFVRDFNIVADPNGRIYISDLWIALKQWYETNGTLEISTLSNGEKKEIWHEQSNKYDKNVVASNQVAKRLKELFPKAKTGSETRDTKRKKATFLAGVKFSDNHNESTTSLLHHSDTESILASPTASLPFTSLHQEKGEAKSEAVTQDGEAKTLTESQSEAVKQNDQPAAAPSRFMERNGHHLGRGVIVMDFEGVIYRIVGEKLIDSWPTVIHDSDQRFQLPDASIFMVLEE